MRLLRCVILGPACLVIVPILMACGWLCGEPYLRHWPRWTAQLIWYGQHRALKMR